MIAAALVGIGFASTAGAEPVMRNNDGRARFAPAASPTDFTTHAKVAYYYSRNGGADTSKNVAKFANPARGVYCITPSVALGYPDVYPHVTIDWGNSVGNILFAYVLLRSNDCVNGPFEVVTYGSNGKRTANVSFIFSLP